ncbi:MAG: hypothetical protein KAS32_29355, partial [Candidatus Peribacteraceae bacterium]|nr:hypothetical protein [Candidatus Peribacteraceae bacterium]
ITSMSADTDKEAYTVINYTFHNHTNNAHAAGNEYAVPADMKAILTGAYGAYDFAGKASATVAIQSSNYTLEVTHTDDDDHQGNHWVGTSTRGVETYNCQYSGNIATPTTPAAGWTLIETAITDGNTVHDNSTQNAERLVLRV